MNSTGNSISLSNPALAGTNVQCPGSGFGLTSPVVTAGAIPPTPLPTVVALVTVSLGGKDAQVISTTLATPNSPIGVYFLTFQVPQGLISGVVPLIVSVGGNDALLTMLIVGEGNLVPTVSSVVNSASNIVPGLPNAGIAQGAVFLIFGSGLGPASLVVDPTPFQHTNLNGTSVTVTVGGSGATAPLYYTSDGQVAALLPSSTPTGTGTVVVGYNGSTSSAAPITVVSNNVGIFTVGANGQGPGIVTYADYSLVSAAKASNCGGPNTTCGAANPGDALILWATGLGPVTGDERNGAGLGVNMPNIPLTVWLGGIQAPVSYQGRSGCCVGEDQIVFTVPDNVPTGCAVPLVVQIGGQVSNYTAMPVAVGSRSCTNSDPGLAPVDIEHAVAAGPVTYGSIKLSRDSNQTRTGLSDTATFQFSRILAYDSGSTPFYPSYLDIPPLGTCTVYDLLNPSANPPIAQSTVADAGPSFTVMGPNGNQTVQASGSGTTTATLSAAGTFLSPGAYTVSGIGGADIGAFSATGAVTPTPTWSVPSLSNRSAGATVTWTGGAAGRLVEIQLSGSVGSSTVGATAVCYASASAGSIAIPPYVTLALPPTNFGALQIRQMTTSPLTAAGLNLGEFQIYDAATSVPFVSQ